MGVYIKGMEIPKTCGECDARHLAKCGVTLQWLLGPEDNYKTKKEDCPLVEIKTPHGRLIDEDALIDDLIEQKIPFNAGVNESIIMTPTILEKEEK